MFDFTFSVNKCGMCECTFSTNKYGVFDLTFNINIWMCLGLRRKDQETWDEANLFHVLEYSFESQK